MIRQNILHIYSLGLGVINTLRRASVMLLLLLLLGTIAHACVSECYAQFQLVLCVAFGLV